MEKDLDIPKPEKDLYSKNVGWRWGGNYNTQFGFLNRFNLDKLEIGYSIVISADWIFSPVDREKMDLNEQRDFIRRAYNAVRTHVRKIAPNHTYAVNTLSEQKSGPVWVKKQIKHPHLFTGYKVFRVTDDYRRNKIKPAKSKKVNKKSNQVSDLFGKSEMKSAPVGVKQIVLDFSEMPASYAYLLGKAKRNGTDPGEIIRHLLDEDMQKVAH